MLLDPALFAAYLAAATLLALTPGPDTMFVLASSASGGSRAGIAATLGISTGGLVHAAAATFGISALIAASPEAFDTIRIVGAVYLLAIGIQAFMRLRKAATQGAAALVAASTLGVAYRRGLLTNISNPKVILFYVAFLPQFANPALGHVPFQILLLGFTQMVIGALWLMTLALAAGSAAERLAGNGRMRRWLDGVAGSVYILLALRIFLLERRPV